MMKHFYMASALVIAAPFTFVSPAAAGDCLGIGIGCIGIDNDRSYTAQSEEQREDERHEEKEEQMRREGGGYPGEQIQEDWRHQRKEQQMRREREEENGE